MNKVKFFIGVDISSEFFTVSILNTETMKYTSFKDFENSINGFQNLLSEFQSYKIEKSDSLICMESTGVYGEKLAYFLVGNNYALVIESPLKVKKAFNPARGKTDKIDSEQIAEYAYRYFDKLKIWSPKSEIIEEIRMFLTQREQFTVQRIANINAKKAVEKKFHKSEKVISYYNELISKIDENIKSIDKEIISLIEKEPEYRQIFANVISIPGVGKILGFHLLAVTNGFSEHLDCKKLASYLGIVPLPFRSGSSIRKNNSSSGIGPSKLRQVIYMASMSAMQCNKELKNYFLRKVAEGKNKRLVINNISNKLLKLIIAIIKSNKPYIEKFVSINPIYKK